MRESPNHSFAVLSCLEKADKPLTATEVQQTTELPLPLVTRILMTHVNAVYPDVEKTEIDEMVTFHYTGEGVLRPPVKEKTAALKKVKVPIGSAKTQTKKSIKEPAKKRISVTHNFPTSLVKSKGKAEFPIDSKLNNTTIVPDPMPELASALDKAPWLNEEFKKHFLGLVNSLRYK